VAWTPERQNTAKLPDDPSWSRSIPDTFLEYRETKIVSSVIFVFQTLTFQVERGTPTFCHNSDNASKVDFTHDFGQEVFYLISSLFSFLVSRGLFRYNVVYNSSVCYFPHFCREL